MSPRKKETFVIAITTFDSNRNLDEGALRFHFERMAEGGVGFYAGGSSPGEQYSLSPEEVRRVLRIAADTLKGKVPCRSMGVEARNAKQMVEFLKLAADMGMEATQIYSLDVGHGMRPSDAELERYWRTCIEACTIPCVISSHMAMGYWTPPEMMKKLTGDYPHLIGINATNQDINYVKKLAEILPERVGIYDPIHFIEGLKAGSTGILTAQGNVIPKTVFAITDEWNKGNHAKAQAALDLQKKFQANPSTRKTSGSVIHLKAAMKSLGLPGHYLRPPFIPMGPDDQALVDKQVKDLDIARIEGIPQKLKSYKDAR